MVALLLAALAAVDPCSGPLAVTLVVDSRLPASLAAEAWTDLTDEVVELGTVLCAPSDAPAAAARLWARLEQELVLEVAVENVVSGRAIRRRLSLAEIPEDARGFAVAQLLAETLRTSWVEIVEAKTAALPPPEPVVVDEPPTESSYEIGAAVRGSGHAGGLQTLGPDVWASVALVDLWRIGGHLGYGVARPTSALHGEIAGRYVWVAPRIEAALAGQRDGLELAGAATLRLGYAELRGIASSGARSATRAVFTGEVGVALELRWLVASRWMLVAGVESGLNLRPITARDGSRAMVALSGLYVAPSLGGAATW